MPAATKRLLWVDDEIDLLRPHLLLMQGRGYHVDAASNGDDAIELVRGRGYDLILLDEQMPGRTGMEVLDEIRRIDPRVPVVMVTKSEEDRTMTEAIGRRVADYLVKPTSPRQVLSVVTRLLEGGQLQQQVTAREFTQRFRDLMGERNAYRGWRQWRDTYSELVDWELRLRGAGETGLLASLETLLDDFRREFCKFVCDDYGHWTSGDEDRPPLSVDIVPEYLAPLLGPDRSALFVIIDCLRLDQWKVIEPVIAPLFDIETTHYFGVLPTATPYARNALFSGLFPNEIAARFPDWWGEREDETLNAHERDFLALTDADLTWLDDSREPERHEFIALAVRQVVVVIELETLGVFDDTGAAPQPVVAAVSSPPPLQ